MAYVKVKWRKDTSKNRELSASDYEKYLLKERGSELVVTCNNCLESQVINQFVAAQAQAGQYEKRENRNSNIAFEVIQSFSPSQSQQLEPQKVNEMGADLAKRYFPNHDFMVVTHTDTEKLHNHILVNPVNQISGKRDVTDKKKHLYNLRTISNEISRENGLSIIRETEQSKSMKLPQKVQEMNRRGAQSRRMDLFQKADLARSYATSFDEYVATLDILKVKVAITEKTITYFYGDTQKGIRGQKLGAHYDKVGLIEQFKSNDDKFAQRPNLRRKIQDGITDYKDGKRDTLGAEGAILRSGGTAPNAIQKDYAAYTKSERRGNRTPVVSDHHLGGSLIPIAEIKKAQGKDIFEYCNKHNIKTELNDKGQRTLKGREHILIDGSQWKNTKNKTVGSLIEFVAFKEDISFIASISKITGNKSLLLLEQYYEPVKRPYKSFYIPKEQHADHQVAFQKVSTLLKHTGINSELTKDLFELKKVQVDKKGSIWFFPEENHHGGLEVSPQKEGGYHSALHGDIASPFFTSKNHSKNVNIYTDPFSYLKHKGKDAFGLGGKQTDLVLFGTHEKEVDIFLAKNPHVQELHIFHSDSSKDKDMIFNFTDKLKQKYKSFSINVEALSLDGVKRDNSRSIDISF